MQVQGQVPSLALFQLQPPQGELRKLLQQGQKMFPSKLQIFSWDLKSPAHKQLGDTRGVSSSSCSPVGDLPYLGCQFAPVRVFVIPQDGASQAIGQVNPDLVLHP